MGSQIKRAADDQRELCRQQVVLANFDERALKSEELDTVLTEVCRLLGEVLGTDLVKVMGWP